jgi:hypothetical protein
VTLSSKVLKLSTKILLASKVSSYGDRPRVKFYEPVSEASF